MRLGDSQSHIEVTFRDVGHVGSLDFYIDGNQGGLPERTSLVCALSIGCLLVESGVKQLVVGR